MFFLFGIYPNPMFFCCDKMINLVDSRKTIAMFLFGVSWWYQESPNRVPYLKIKYTLLVVSDMFYVHPYLGNDRIYITNILQMGWNHQLDTHTPYDSSAGTSDKILKWCASSVFFYAENHYFGWTLDTEYRYNIKTYNDSQCSCFWCRVKIDNRKQAPQRPGTMFLFVYLTWIFLSTKHMSIFLSWFLEGDSGR